LGRNPFKGKNTIARNSQRDPFTGVYHIRLSIYSTPGLVMSHADSFNHAMKAYRNLRLRLIVSMLLVCCFGSTASQASTVQSVKLTDLLEGLSLDVQIRFKIKDIVVEKQSVKYLFDAIGEREASWWEYYTFQKTPLRLTVKNSGDLAKLQQTLTAQHADRLRVILRDDRNVIWKQIPGLRSEQLYSDTLELVISQTPCDEITRIVYESINFIINEEVQKAGVTAKRININEVFDKLLHDKIEPYIDGLDPISKEHSCFRTFQLLKWVKGEDVDRFDSGEFRLHDGLQQALEPTNIALLDLLSNWSQYTLSVRVVGYTDSVVVRRDREFRLENTGIAGWDTVKDPVNVRYSGCINDKLTQRQPVYIGFGENSGQAIEYITDNCKLGAARAYVATAYLRSKLGVDGVQNSYATGGIYPTRDNNEKADATKRKVNIEVTMKAARTEKP
jgi:hypothetical protein